MVSRLRKKKVKVDFRNQIGVYALYDKNEHIVYIGQAGKGKRNLFDRLKDHQRDRLWNRWKYFSWVGFYPVSEKTDPSGVHQLLCSDANESVSDDYKFSDALNEIEAVLIELVEPKLNKRGSFLASKLFEYLQYVEDPNDVEGEDDEEEVEEDTEET